MRRPLIEAAAGAIAGCGAMLVFLAVHAVAIVPIWSSIGSGLAFAVPLGATISVAASRVLGRPQRMRDGLFLGAIAWVGIAINTAIVRGMRIRDELEVPVALLAAFAFGALVASRISRRILAGGLASIAVLLVVHGPVSSVFERRGALILIGLLPVMVAFGLAQARVAHWFTSQGDDDAERNHDAEIGSRDRQTTAA